MENNLVREDFLNIVGPHRRHITGTDYDIVDVAALINEFGAENLRNPAIRRTVELARSVNEDVIALLAGDAAVAPEEPERKSANWLRRLTLVLALLAGFVGTIVPLVAL